MLRAFRHFFDTFLSAAKIWGLRAVRHLEIIRCAQDDGTVHALVQMNKPQPIRIGLIGLDTSHVIAFTKVLNDPANPDPANALVKGGETITAVSRNVAESERTRWELFEENNVRNATAAYSEFEWE